MLYISKKKKALCALAVMAVTAAGIVSAEAYNVKEMAAVEASAETGSVEAVEENQAQAIESWRIDKNRIWLNQQQADESREAPIFIALCLHEVRDDLPDDDLALPTWKFRKIVRELKEQGYWFLDSNDIIAIKKGEMEQPDKAVFLSFDDGYVDNYTNAFPIIREEGVKATFFLVSSLIGTPGRMTVGQLQHMASLGMCFGSHTVNHAELDKLSAEEIEKEMNDSKYVLQHDYGVKVESIAYPCGFQSEKVVEEAQENYEIAFTASMDENTPDTTYTIHRYGVFRWNDSLASILKN